MDSSEGWDSASMDYINVKETTKKQKTTIQMARLKILHQIMFSIKLLKRPRTYCTSKGINDFEIVSDCLSLKNRNGKFLGMFTSVKSDIEDDYEFSHEDEIVKFLSLNLNLIPCRLYFVLDKSISCFIEYVQNNVIVRNKNTYQGNVFSVDFNGYINDQTHVFSKNCVHYKFFSKILDKIKANVIAESTAIPSAFSELDSTRIKAIPANVNKIKTHPLYIMEEVCSIREAIYPKRPICGYIKGSPVYPRSLLIRLRSESTWMREGKKIKKDAKPYRIFKDIKLYADFQTENIVVESLIPGKTMDAFHPNFTPIDCVYINYSSEIAKLFNIPYSDCKVKITHQGPVIQGFFVRKVDCYKINLLIKEAEYYNEIKRRIEDYEETIKSWKKFLAKLVKYCEIKNRIGM